jgi:hypothetical protein
LALFVTSWGRRKANFTNLILVVIIIVVVILFCGFEGLHVLGGNRNMLQLIIVLTFILKGWH